MDVVWFMGQLQQWAKLGHKCILQNEYIEMQNSCRSLHVSYGQELRQNKIKTFFLSLFKIYWQSIRCSFSWVLFCKVVKKFQSIFLFPKSCKDEPTKVACVVEIREVIDIGGQYCATKLSKKGSCSHSSFQIEFIGRYHVAREKYSAKLEGQDFLIGQSFSFTAGITNFPSQAQLLHDEKQKSHSMTIKTNSTKTIKK